MCEDPEAVEAVETAPPTIPVGMRILQAIKTIGTFLWTWPVVATLAFGFLGAAAISAMYASAYKDAGILCAFGVILLTVKAIMWEEVAKHENRVWMQLFIAAIAAFVLIAAEVGIYVHYYFTRPVSATATAPSKAEPLSTVSTPTPSAPTSPIPRRPISSDKPKRPNPAQDVAQPSVPPSLICQPGSNCAQSTGQSGGVTAGQINIGAPLWKSYLDGDKQKVMISSLSNTTGKIRIAWIFQDIDGMQMAGFLNYAFMQAKWTSDQPDNYAGGMCYPSQKDDCYGLKISVRNRHSKMAETAINAITAIVPDAKITEADTIPDDRVEVFIAKASLGAKASPAQPPQSPPASSPATPTTAPISASAPPMTQECEPGASCAQSSGQQGGITAGTVNIGNVSRHLEASDRDALISNITGLKSKVHFAVIYGIPDALEYESELAKAINDAHVTVMDDVIPMAWAGGKKTYGVEVDYHGNPTPDGEKVLIPFESQPGILIGALMKAHIKVGAIHVGQEIPEDEIKLIVCFPVPPKPP